jgi:hypothetical protein
MSHKVVIAPSFSVEFILVVEQNRHKLTAYCQLSLGMIHQRLLSEGGPNEWIICFTSLTVCLKHIHEYLFNGLFETFS